MATPLALSEKSTLIYLQKWEQKLSTIDLMLQNIAKKQMEAAFEAPSIEEFETMQALITEATEISSKIAKLSDLFDSTMRA